MKYGITLVTAAVLGLTGCATTAGYEQALQSWVGSSEERLVQVWGAPAQSYKMENGSKIVTYVRSSVNSYTNFYPNINYAYTTTYEDFCKTEFTLDTSGTITNWRWQGNACKFRMR